MCKVTSLFLLVAFALLVNTSSAKSLKLTSAVAVNGKSTKRVSRKIPVDDAALVGVVAGPVNPAAAYTASQSTLKGLACIIGGALTHLTFGSLYCWGNFNSYAPSHLRSDLVFPLTMVAQCLTMPFGPLFVKKLGARTTLLLGAWIMAAGVFFSSYAKNSAVFIMLYAIVFGGGVGLAYTAPMIAGWSWMPQSKGLVSGAVLTGFGAGGFFFNIIGSKIANPLGVDPVNGKFPAEVYEQFPVMLRKLAMIYVGLSFLGSLLISEPVVSKEKVAVTPNVPGVSIGEALKTNQFWLMWAMIITSASAGLNVAAMYKQFAGISPALKGDSYQSVVGAVGALFNAMGRLFWGALSDKIGFKNSFMALTVSQAAVQFLYPYSAKSKKLFLATNCMSFFLLAGNFAMMPPAIQRMFGPKNGALIYGLIYSAFGTASLATILLSKGMITNFGWDGVFKVLAGVSVVATLLTSMLTPLASLASSTV